MNRIVKIGILVVVLFLLGFWVSTMVKSCNKPATAEIETTEQVASVSESDDFEDDFFEDNLGEESETTSYQEEATSDDFDSDYEQIDEVLDNSSETVPVEPKRQTRTVSTPVARSTSGTGRYMVLAGSYLIKENANNMVRKLNKLGYNSAEIVIFNLSQYHSVCAARRSSYNEAVQISNELKSRGIDNYVHKKQ